MNILVLVKQVPDTEAQIKISPDGKKIVSEGVKFIINPYDEYAIEEALRIKEKLGTGTVTVLSLGPPRVKEALRNCLALGADQAIHLVHENGNEPDSYGAIFLLAQKIKTLPHDLILCGNKAIDDDMSQVGGGVAELLGLPFVSLVTKLEVDPQKKSVVLQRQIEGGLEKIECPLPALLSAQKGLNEPRYASLAGMMKAKKKEIEEIKIEDLVSGGEIARKTEIVKLDEPPPRRPGRILQGEVKEQVQQLVRLLREEAKVI